MMESRYLDKMLANRMWAHFMGYGFTKPIDDMGPHIQRRIQNCWIIWANKFAKKF